MFVMLGAVVCQTVSVRVVGDNCLKVIFRRSVRQIINDVSAAEAAGRLSPKRGRGFQCSQVFLNKPPWRDLKAFVVVQCLNLYKTSPSS